MTLLDQVKQMQQQGMSDAEINQQLKESGYRALEISQAIEQSKIKAAVSRDEQQMNQQTEEPLPYEENQMQPSVMQQQEFQEPVQPQYQPQEEQYAERQEQEYIYPTPQAYSDSPGGGYEEYQPYQQTTETTTEIAEQIAEEKIDKVRKELSSLSIFKTTAERKIKNIDDRLKKIEDMIEKLQSSIIGKIGTYGQNIEDLKKEMILTQQSFSKAITTKKTTHRPITKTKKKSGKRKAGIEHYLRR